MEGALQEFTGVCRVSRGFGVLGFVALRVLGLGLWGALGGLGFFFFLGGGGGGEAMGRAVPYSCRKVQAPVTC